MESKTNRRGFIKTLALTALGFSVFDGCDINIFNKSCKLAQNLVPDPEKYLSLSAGFTYAIISQSGDLMDDGFFVPGRPDGMGTFQSNAAEKVVIVRNHENSPYPLRNSPFGPNNELLSNLNTSKLYDAGNRVKPGLGGTTTIIYNESTKKIEQQYLSLAGTYRNCAGGVTPWGSWLSCEEDVTKAGANTEKNHGFLFEVPALQPGLADPLPLTAMGRFNREAVAVDPVSSIVYMTEDRPDGLLYRFIPNVAENLVEGGQLQCLCVKNKPQMDTRNWKETVFEINVETQVEWKNIDSPLAPEDDLRYRGFDKGAARFARGEGIWFGDSELYFACTNGGPGKWGQIFRYKLSPDEGNETDNSKLASLELYKESTDRGVLNMCDNLTITPWGDLMICEDNGNRNRILQLKQDGSITVFGCNESSDSEFAGIVFSPSGNTLFVNIQENGDTLAITGPWETIV